MKLGAQFYTIRALTTTADGFERALAQVRALGYEGVQLSAVGCMNGDQPEVDAKRARAMLDREGLVCCATHRPPQRLLEMPDEEIEFHQILGCPLTGIGAPPPDAWENGLESFGRFVGKLVDLAPRYAEAGVKLALHNHALEFQRLGPERRQPWEQIVNAASLQVILDTYWVAVAGVDVVRTVEQLPGRLEVVHLKDVEPVDWSVKDAPVGEGNLDWDAILPAFKKAGTRWLVVEQDECRRDPYDCLRSSIEYVRAKL